MSKMINYTTITIDGQKYQTVELKTHWDWKYLEKRIKSVREKVRAYEKGSTGNKYKNYRQLLDYLENQMRPNH